MLVPRGQLKGYLEGVRAYIIVNHDEHPPYLSVSTSSKSLLSLDVIIERDGFSRANDPRVYRLLEIITCPPRAGERVVMFHSLQANIRLGLITTTTLFRSLILDYL